MIKMIVFIKLVVSLTIVNDDPLLTIVTFISFTKLSLLWRYQIFITKLSLLLLPICHDQIVTFVSLPNSHYQIVVTKLSPYQIVITKLSLPNWHYQKSAHPFQDLGFFSFTKTLRQTPKGVTHMLSLCLVIQPLNLEKTTSNVLSVLLLIYDYKDMINTRFDLIWLKVKKIISCLISSIRNRFT